jgi:hypothetical protein
MKRIAPLLVLGITAATGCYKEPKPAPAVLTVTPEAVTLIQEAEDRCVKVAKLGIERVRTAEEEQQKARDEALEAVRNGADPKTLTALPKDVDQDILEKYLKEEAMPQLTAVDRAGELIHDLMPKVRDEAPVEVHRAIQNLLANQEQVCVKTRNAKPTRSAYQENLDYAVHDYGNAEAKLEMLYVVSSTDAEFALSKYKPMLEEARAGAEHQQPDPLRKLTPEQLRHERKEWEATQDLQQQQQAEHEAAVVRWRQREEGKAPLLGRIDVAPEVAAKGGLAPEKRQQTMKAWYNHYSGKVEPVRTALASYMTLRRGSFDKLQPVCQELLTASAAILNDPASLDLPDATAAKALKRAYTELQECARSCVNGMDAESAFRLAAYQGAISQATTALQSYDVTP